jgi:IclR family acetate operon transcriptional repressor
MTTGRFSLTAIDRAMTILEAFEDSTELSLADVSRASGLSEATALRYATSLTTHGLLERNGRTGRYRLGMRLFLLGGHALRDRDPRSAALPHMQRLRERFDETVNLATRNGDELILIEVLESRRPIRKGAHLGERDRWATSALGKAILAHLAESEARLLLAGEVSTDFDLDRLLAELGVIRARGYAVDNGECEPDLRCVAAVIFDRVGTPCHALSVAGPESRLALRSVPTIGVELRDAAATISASLGHLPSLLARKPAGRSELVAT